MSDGFRIASAYVQVEASDDGFRAQLDAKVKAAAEGAAAKVKVKADAEALPEEVKAAAAAAHAEAHVKVKVDQSGDFEAQFRRAMEEGDAVMASAASDLRDSFDAIEQGSQALRAAFEDAGNGAENAGKDIEGAGKKADSSKGAWAQLKDAAGTTGTALKIIAGISLAPALGAIPGMAAGAAGALGALALGLGDVAKVLHEAGQAAAATGQSQAQLALTAYTNAVAIRGAKQTIVDAERSAAQQAISSAEQIGNAERAVADAVRQAAQQQISSAEQVAGAQQSLTDAQRQAAISQQNSLDSIASANLRLTQAQTSEATAQRDLTLAQQDAANTLADLNNANQDAALQAQGAELALEQATRNNDATQQNSLATPLEKRQALLALAQAHQGVKDAQQRALEAQQAADRANKETATGLPAVVSAQQKVKDSIQAVADANHAVQIANRDAANQQISSSEQVANAVQRLGDAQRQQINQQISSAEQVAGAQQRLADAQRTADQQKIASDEQVRNAKQALIDLEKTQALSAAAAAASSATAANQFAKDYGKLTPAGKAFVDQVLSMRSSLHLLEADAQSAMLPGFTQMLKDSNHLLPTVELGVKGTGKAFGDTAIAFGQLFANPRFDASAQQFTQLVVGGFGQFLSALPPLLDAIVTQGVRAAPLINAVAVGVHDLIGTGLPAFLAGLNVNASGAAVGVGALFHGVNDLLGPIGTLTGAVAGALGPAVAVLVSGGIVPFVTAIEQSLLPIMPQLSTDLVDVAHVFDKVLQIAEPLIPVLVDGLGSGLRIVDPILQETAKLLHDNATWLTPVAAGVLAVVAAVKTWSIVSPVVGKASSALNNFSGAAKQAGKDAEAAGESVGGVRGFAGKLGQSLPIIGAAVIAGGTLVALLSHISDIGVHAAASVDQYTLALNSNNAAALPVVGAGAAIAKMADGLVGKLPPATSQMAALGITAGVMDQKFHGGGDALKNYDQALAGMVTSGHAAQAKTFMDQITAATDSHGKALVNTARDFPSYFAALDHQAAVEQTATTKTDETKTALDRLGQSAQTTTDKFQYMSDTMSKSEALDRFHTQLLGLKQAADDNGTSLDGNTAKAGANRQAFSDLADQIREYGKKLHDSGDADGVVGSKMQDMITTLENQAGAYGFNKKQVDDYIKSIGLIPPSAVTDLNTIIRVQMDEQALAAAAIDIGHAVAHHLIPGQAVGGLVTGPGTGTSDSILRRVSNGEYIVPADATAAIGPAGMEQIRQGRIPQVGGTTPQAAPTINLNYYGTQLPTPEQQQVMMRDFALAVRG